MYLYPDFKIIKLKSVDSTNTYAQLFIKNNLYENIVVVASEQTKGRGQQGNYWYSEKDKNLTFTIILDTHFINANEQFQLNKVVSLSVKRFIEKILNTIVTIKWPNDIYINDKKIAGVLIENSIMDDRLLGSIIGIGINVNQTIFPENIPNPLSMIQVSGLTYNLDELLLAFLNIFKEEFSKILNNDNENINTDYLKSLFRMGVKNRFIYNNNLISATIRDVDEYGRLLLVADNDNEIICNFKDIQFVL